jgi:ATP-binding cassette subfamily C protein CydD
MLIIGFLSVIQGIAIIFQAVFLSAAITNMFKGAAFSAVLPFLAYFAGVFTLRHFMQWVKERISFRFAEKTSLQLQNTFIKKLFELGPHAVGKHGSGNLITLCLEGIPSFRTYLELFIPRSIAMAIIPIILLIYAFSLDTLSGVVLILTMPIMVAFLILLGLVAKKKIGDQMHTFQLLSSHFVDSLRGLVTLKYLGKSKSHQKSIENVSNQYRIATNQTLRIAFLSSFSLDFFSSLSVAVVAVELGLRLVEGTIGLETALAILIVAPEYFLPIRSLGADYHATMDGKEAGKKIQRLLDEARLVGTGEKIQISQWDEDSVLEIRNLRKKSDDEDRLILKDMNFHIKGCQKIGIAGASGAGKSTLIEILSGFSLPSAGEIFVNGEELSNFAVEGWQKQITYIPQHPYIFSGTVAENISWYTPDAQREEIEKAIEVAGLTELINSLPNGLEEKIGQGGRSLSGGEEQRIALSRSLLEQRPIMLFDEPTAHLDIETEHDIKKMILPILEGKLVFFATHRLHWMKEMDFILVIEDGRLVESGTHDELIMKKSAYYRLIQAHQGGMQE